LAAQPFQFHIEKTCGLDLVKFITQKTSFNMDIILFRSFSRMVIMTLKMDPCAEGGAGILIQESSIKAIDVRTGLGKAQLITRIMG
jgi:hypothetical protein